MNILKNKEFEKSLYITIIVNIILGLLLSIVFIKEISRIKVNYLEEKAHSIGYLSNKYPKMTTDIVNSSFKINNEDNKDKGLKILNDYGYNTELDLKYFENIHKPIKYMVLDILVVFLIILAVQFFLLYIYHKNVYKNISKITLASKEILSQNYNIEIMQYKEGEFSRLAYGFNEMKDVIKNQMEEIKKEKQFLVELTSDISHQLKTPLASIVIFNDILLNETDVNDPKYKFLLKSKIQLDRMDWLIKSILKLSRLDAKVINFEMENNKLYLILEEAISDLDTIAIKNNVKVNFCNTKDVMLNCDKEWTKEAFINVIKNGIEHSKNGEVSIYIQDNEFFTKVNVQDSGEGIKEEDIHKIFTRFHRGNKTDSVGIGLSLSKSIIEAQKGYIEVKSKYGEGSLFKIIFIK